MKNDKWLDLTNGVCWSIIFSLIAIIMSIVAVANKCPRYNHEFDYLGLLIGIVSLLVTVMLGWNIFQAIDLKKAKEEMAEIAEKSSWDAQKAFHEDLAMHACRMEMEYEEAYHILWLIILESKLGNYNQCDSLISRMSGIKKSEQKDTRGSTLKSVAALIENKDKISRYKDIDGIIDNLFI